MSDREVAELERRRESVKAQLAAVGDLRRGSLVERYRKCGKGNCCCAAEGSGGHGPSWSLTWRDDAKTRTKIIPAEAVGTTRAQITEFRRFRRLSRELIELSEHLCDARLEGTQAEAQATAKKGGLKKRSRRRSATRSARC